MLKLYAKNNSPERIEQVVSVLRDGGVIIIPRAQPMLWDVTP